MKDEKQTNNNQDQNEKVMSIFDRISAIMENVGSIRKTAFNSHTNKPTRGKEEFLNAFQIHFQTFGVVMTFDIKEWKDETFPSPSANNPSRICFRTTIFASVSFSCDNGSVATDVLSIKNDYGDFGAMSAMSLAITRALEIVFCVGTEDQFSEAPKEINKQPSQHSGPSPDEVAVICGEVSLTGDAAELEKIWHTYPNFHSEAWFKRTVREKKKIFVNQALEKLPVKTQNRVQKPTAANG